MVLNMTFEKRDCTGPDMSSVVVMKCYTLVINMEKDCFVRRFMQVPSSSIHAFVEFNFHSVFLLFFRSACKGMLSTALPIVIAAAVANVCR